MNEATAVAQEETLDLAERLNHEEDLASADVLEGIERAAQRLDRLGWSE